MNWLAHLYLSEKDDDVLIGNLLGDFYNKRDMDRYSEGIKRGIHFHFKIDAFTDHHPFFRLSKRRVSEKNRRLSGILIDIYYDHFLAKKWSRYSNRPLEKFLITFDNILLKNKQVLPEKLQKVLPRMIKENWMLSYANVVGIHDILKRTSKRLSFPNQLSEEIFAFKENYLDFEADFNDFFPQLTGYANSLKRDSTQGRRKIPPSLKRL